MATNPDVLSAMENAEGRVARVVRRLMRDRGVTGKELAEAFGISRQAMSYRLTGRTVIPAGEVPGFASYFGVPIDVLYLEPDEAVRWVLDHPETCPKWLVRNRCYEPSALVAVALAG